MQGKGSTLDAAIRTFVLDRRIGGCSRATLEAYTFQLEPFVKWARTRSLDLDDLAEEHLREFLLQRGKAGHATLYSATVRLKTFFKWCVAEGLCRDLAAALRKPRQAQAVVSALTIKELQALLLCCRGNGFVGRRDEALVRFLVDTAARISEALDLTIDRLEVDSGRALLNGKGGKERFVFFGSKTAKALIRYLAGCESKGFHLSRSVFVNRDGTPVTRRHGHQVISRLGRRAKIRGKRCSPHTLRHSGALLYLKNGGDALSLQRLLGHSTLAMTNRYVSSASVDDIAAAHRRCSPGETL